MFQDLHAVVLHVDAGAKEGLQKAQPPQLKLCYDANNVRFRKYILTAWINLRITILAVLGILLMLWFQLQQTGKKLKMMKISARFFKVAFIC